MFITGKGVFNVTDITDISVLETLKSRTVKFQNAFIHYLGAQILFLAVCFVLYTIAFV